MPPAFSMLCNTWNQAIYHQLNLGVGVGTVMAAVRASFYLQVLCFVAVLGPAAFNDDRVLQSAKLHTVQPQHNSWVRVHPRKTSCHLFLCVCANFSLCMARSAVKLTPGPLSSRVFSKRKSMDACNKLLKSNSCYCFHNPPRVEALYNKSRWSECYTLKAIFTGRWSVCSVVCCVLGGALISCF